MSKSGSQSPLRRGALVEVRPLHEIALTLDGNGSLDGLPFMPEMAQFCGQRFRVFHHVIQAVIDTAFLRPKYTESFVREFKHDDVVVLEEVRCCGVAHDGCGRGCLVFWKEAWLRPVDKGSTPGPAASNGADALLSSLKTQAAAGTYYCQSSEILKATSHLGGWQRLGKWWRGIQIGNYIPLAMIKQTFVWCRSRVLRRVFGPWPRGTRDSTPCEELGLMPGDCVEVKPLAAILETLDKNGRNRGLHFSADMGLLCGKQFRVRRRADQWIAEGTGQMRKMRNTVILEGATCDSAYYAFGGCPRSDYQYWREIWLKKL